MDVGNGTRSDWNASETIPCTIGSLGTVMALIPRLSKMQLKSL